MEKLDIDRYKELDKNVNSIVNSISQCKNYMRIYKEVVL